MKALTLETALQLLAQPAGATEDALQGAARVVNEGIATAAGELAALEERWARESLDLVSRGNKDVLETISENIRKKRERLEQLRHAAREANRRMESALRATEAAEKLQAWRAAEALMAEREKATARLVALTNELGQVYAQIAALADRVWDALPDKPHGNPQNIDFFDPAGMEVALDWSLHYATGWQFGNSRLGSHPVPDLVAACRRGHRELASKKPLEGLRQGLTIDAAEFERRTATKGA